MTRRDPGGAVQRRECHHHLGRAAVRARDDPAMRVDRFGVHLGDDQRDVRIHPPTPALVDHDGAGVDGPAGELGRHLVRRAGDHQIDVAKRPRLQQLDADAAIPDDHLLAGTLRGRQQLQRLHREAAAKKLIENNSADGPGGTDDGYRFIHAEDLTNKSRANWSHGGSGRRASGTSNALFLEILDRLDEALVDQPETSPRPPVRRDSTSSRVSSALGLPKTW